MSSESGPTRKQRREEARAARVEAEHAQAAAAQRRRRLVTLGGVLAAAAVVVVVAIAVSGGGGDKASDRPQAAQTASGAIPGQKESGEMLAGIPQKGIYLGKADAPVRLVEFADLQCPICREYSLQSLPQLVQDYVRTGKVRMEFRNLSFLGPDSVTAGRAAAAAARQNRLWNFAHVLYYNQGEENSGYVTQDFIDRINKAAGVDSAEADAFAKSAASQEPLGAANTLANQYRVDSTPTILVGRRGGQLKAVDAVQVRDRRRARPGVITDRHLRIGAIILALIGLGVAGYLTYVHYEEIRPVCGLGGDCVKVQASEWSKLAGIPVALLGLIGYAVIFVSLFVPGEEALIAGALTSLIGFGFSAYLTYRELFTIDAICQWCVASAIIMTLLAVVTTARLLRAPGDQRGAIPYVG